MAILFEGSGLTFVCVHVNCFSFLFVVNKLCLFFFLLKALSDVHQKLIEETVPLEQYRTIH